MRYNQLTYHKANPFYKQGYLPDSAWYNRKPKDYPSEIPTGQEYFVQSGRKHFAHRFNHSQIQDADILKSPERYPFQNRIAMDKNYMRNLDTIDIEGASGGTRVSQAIKNKFKAQQQLARRHNQSTDNALNKEKSYEDKRRQIALKQFETIGVNQMKQNQKILNQENHQKSINSKKYSQHSKDKDISDEYKNYVMRNSSNKYFKLMPKIHYEDSQQSRQNAYAHHQQDYQKNEISYQSQQINKTQNQQRRKGQYQRQMEKLESEKYNNYLQSKINQRQSQQREESLKNSINTNNRFKSNPEYVNAYDIELNKRRDEYLRNLELEQTAKNKISDRKDLRKYNPTNLSVSLNLAAQNIVYQR